MAKNEFTISMPEDQILSDEQIDRIKNRIMKTVAEEVLNDKFQEEADSVGVDIGPVNWNKEY